MSIPTKNKKAKQTKSGIMPRLKMASKKARMLILLLIFVNYGAYFAIVSYADSYSVNFILFCGSGPGECNGDVNQLDLDAGRVNVWYGEQTGKTFVRNPTARIYGEQNGQYYRGGSALSTATTHGRIYAELMRRGVINATTRAVVRMGFPSMSNCGVSDAGEAGRLAIADPFAHSGLCANQQDAVMAHELGHFVLGGNEAHTAGKNSLMASWACSGAVLNSCDNLTEAQKNAFRSTSWFTVARGSNKSGQKAPSGK